MTTYTPLDRQFRYSLTDLERSRIPHRPFPLTVVWRWRYEVALTLLLTAGLISSWRSIGLARTVVAVLVTTGLCAASPPVRAWLHRRALCILTPHRVRACCAQSGIHARNGRLPAVLLTRATPTGERIILWCPAGTTPSEFTAARELLRTACWAMDVVAREHPRHPQLAMLDVIRRPVVATTVQPPVQHTAQRDHPVRAVDLTRSMQTAGHGSAGGNGARDRP